MKLQLIFSLLLFVFTSIAHADEKAGTVDVDNAVQKNTTQYFIALSEYQLKKAIPIGISEAEILETIRNSEAIPIETVQVTAVSETECLAKFGRRASVTTGKTTNGKAVSRQTEFMEIGTIFRVNIDSHPKGAIANIDYTTSRLDGEGTDGSPPDVATTTVQSTQILALGEERLLSVSGTSTPTCIVVFVKEIP